MSELIRARLHYVFADEQLLHSALRSAHREKDDDVLDDGNRGLAHYGILAIQMAMTYEAIIDKGKTLYDIHAQDHWSKTRKSRAKVCRLLGVDSLIMQSVRQQHERPSDTVLDHAFSAVIGAIWLDCERQEHKVSHIRSIILEVLRIIDATVDQHSFTADCVIGINKSPGAQCNLTADRAGWYPETTELDQENLDEVDSFTRKWFEQELGGIFLESVPHQNRSSELQPLLGQNDCTSSLDNDSVLNINVSNLVTSIQHSAPERTDDEPCADRLRYERQSSRPSEAETEQRSISTVTVKGVKRKRHQDENEKFDCLYHKMLQAEQQKLMRCKQVEKESLGRFLRHPKVDKLERRGSVLARFLYLAIGSWETIVDFQDLFQLYRSDTSVYRPTNTLSCNAGAMYDEICRLDKEEALCVLLKRYYIINLCEEEQLYNDHHSHIIVDTPSTVDKGRVARPGNPLFALDSSLTEKLLLKIMPDTDPASADFQRARVKVKRLRKLAERLRRLVKRYGVGVLGLLPSGPSFKQMSLTDNMLLSMTETTFNDFALILHQEQGPHLESLSRLIEPSLLALATGFVSSDTVCSSEWASNSFFVNIPKGLLGQELLQIQ